MANTRYTVQHNEATRGMGAAGTKTYPTREAAQAVADRLEGNAVVAAAEQVARIAAPKPEPTPVDAEPQPTEQAQRGWTPKRSPIYGFGYSTGRGDSIYDDGKTQIWDES